MAAAVDVEVTTWTADIEKVLVNGEAIYRGVKVLFDQVDPCGMIY